MTFGAMPSFYCVLCGVPDATDPGARRLCYSCAHGSDPRQTMTTDALLLVLAGATMHAAWNYLAKLASGGQAFVSLYSAVSFVFAAPVCLWFFVNSPASFSSRVVIAALVSALIHVFYSLALQRGYQLGDLTVVYPIARGTGPLFSIFGALLVLGERPSVVGWVGIATIFCGIVFIAGGRRIFAPAKSFGLANGLRWGVLTGLCIALYTIVDGWSVKTLSAQPIAYYSLGLTLRMFLLAPFALHDVAALKSEWQMHAPHIVAVGVLSPLAYTLVLFAMTLAPLSYVAPMRELSLMIAALLGAGFLKEDDARLRIAGSALMTAGVIVLALA